MLKNNIILIVFVVAIISSLGTILLCNTTFGSVFFTITLFQVLQLLITLFIGVYLSTIVSHRRSKETKRTEFSLKIIDDTGDLIQDEKDQLFLLLSDTITDESKKMILQIIRKIHNKLDILDKLNCTNIETKGLKSGALECSVEIKDKLTEEWGQDKKITADDRESVKRNIDNIVARLDQIKLSLLNK